MTSLARFLQLPAADRKLLVLAGALLLAVRLGLWLLPFRVVRRLALGAAAAGERPACLRPERIAWAVATAARLGPGATCLPRALVAESGRGLDFFRSAVIDVLGIHVFSILCSIAWRAVWADSAPNGIA